MTVSIALGAALCVVVVISALLAKRILWQLRWASDENREYRAEKDRLGADLKELHDRVRSGWPLPEAMVDGLRWAVDQGHVNTRVPLDTVETLTAYLLRRSLDFTAEIARTAPHVQEQEPWRFKLVEQIAGGLRFAPRPLRTELKEIFAQRQVADLIMICEDLSASRTACPLPLDMTDPSQDGVDVESRGRRWREICALVAAVLDKPVEFGRASLRA